MQQCIRQSEDVHCWGYVKNLTDGTINLRMNHTNSTFIDDEGNAGIFVAMVATEHLIPGTPIRYEFDFHDSHRNVKSLNFEIKVHIEGDPSPRLRYDTFTFKDVPLQTPEQQTTREPQITPVASSKGDPNDQSVGTNLPALGGAQVGDFFFSIQSCRRSMDRGRSRVECDGTVTSQGSKTESLEIDVQKTYILDDLGNQSRSGIFMSSTTVVVTMGSTHSLALARMFGKEDDEAKSVSIVLVTGNGKATVRGIPVQ